MADSWEENDWENDDFTPALPAANATPETKPAANPLTADIDLSKFADEDAELEAEEKKHAVPAPQPKKKEEKKYMKAELSADDIPLDDPVAEKLRRQRLEEQADFAAARELFGGAGKVNLDGVLPKSLKEFEDYAATLVSQYVTVHKESKNYKAFLKALIKGACAPLTSSDAKDIESSVASVRLEKSKAEAAEAAAKKGVKKSLNVGKGSTAGLDDYIYDDAGQGDDFDFM